MALNLTTPVSSIAELGGCDGTMMKGCLANCQKCKVCRCTEQSDDCGVCWDTSHPLSCGPQCIASLGCE